MTAKPNAKPSHRLPITAVGLSLVALLASGCASTKVEDPAKARTEAVQDISKQWKQGSELVTAGEKTKAKGTDLVTQGQRQIAEGESQISRGRTLMAESENAFRDASRNAPAR